jgi:translocation and assembly module TamB
MSAPSSPPPSKQPAPARLIRRAAMWLGTWSLRSLSALLGPIVLVVLAASLWFWAGTEGSLGTALKWADKALPAGQHLTSSNVQGSLRQGGRIGQVAWRAPLLQVQAQDADIAIDWSLLWKQPWPVQSLHLKSLHIQDQRPTKPLTPWPDLNWPLPVQMALKVDHFQWQGATPVTLTGVQAHYAYDGRDHTLKVPALTMAQGQYSLQARLQGTAPMALKLDIEGLVKTSAIGGTPALALLLNASAQGSLSGPEAQLKVTADLVPSPHQPSWPQGKAPVQLSLQADVRPWQQPAIVQAQGQWQALNLAPLWPQAPQTHLTGHAQLKPDGPDWSLQAELHNLLPGAWDLQRLPLTHLTLNARHQQGLWQVLPSQAQMAEGHIQVQGAQSPAGWTGNMAVSGIQPAQLHSALAGPPIQGQLQAQDTGSGPIRFDAQLQSAAAPIKPAKALSKLGPAPGLHFEQLTLSGHWQDEVWHIDALKLMARQATMEARFKYSPRQTSIQGQWSVQLPGLRAKAEGQLAPLEGQGQIDMDVKDAAASWAWVQKLPGWGDRLSALKASGPGQIQAQWQGGYAQAQTSFKVNAQWARLSWQTPQQAAWVLGQGQLQMEGTPLSWQAQWQSHLAQGSASSRLQARLSAVRPHLHSQQWRGLLDSLDLEELGAKPQAAWRLQLQKSMAWQADLGQSALALSWSNAHLQVQGPSPGNSRVQIEPGHWHSASTAQTPRSQLAARWEDLPLNWLPSAWRMGIQNDVHLQGQVQLTQNEDTTLTAQIRRSRGDLRIQTEPSPGQLTAAGLREANLVLHVHNEKLQADLQWDSAHMGQAQAQVLSTLSRTQDGWKWPAQAPLRGTVKAQLPQIGAWSVLAPPGWRVQGTLDAQFDLAGTRSQPQWQGLLQAHQLAVRSAVQGIAFDQGQMQARLIGQELILDSLSLRGVGPQGGEFSAQGRINLAPNASTTTPSKSNPLHAAQMSLQMEAKSLRLSNRADRRLVMSGQVTAQMQTGLMQIRGLLKADQALFLLPDESTPNLGDDVVVVRPPSGSRDVPSTSVPKPTETTWFGVPDVRVTLDLGPDFQLQGKGLNTRLTGQLDLVSNASTQGLPRLQGQVRTLGGRYKAYGQQLNISTGVLRFNGAYDNPGLEIIALRPHLPQPVGVQVSGNALLPRIRLYADPDMPDADKLAWLVLGRSAASGGAESAVLQQAAMALLSGNGKTFSSELAGNLGLDEISLATSTRTGTTATGAAVTLGKRLSQDFYMAYETSLSGTLGSLFIFYDISRRLTLRAQAAEQSALDLIFTIRKD